MNSEQNSRFMNLPKIIETLKLEKIDNFQLKS